MSQFDNTPIMPPSSGTPGLAGWFPVWIKSVSQPNEQTFIDISESPEAQPKTAYIWVFAASTLVFFVSAIVQAVVMAISGGSNNTPASMFGGSLIAFVCLSPVIGGVSVLFFALWTTIIQWIAKLFGGTGTYNKLVYTVAAIYVPVSLVSMLLTPFNTIPFINICTGLISVGLVFYSLFLNITAVKAVNRFGWGQAAGSVLLPGIVILLVCGCLVIGILALMGPMIGNVFSEINQSLQTVP